MNMPALLAQLHPTYRCAICRSLLVMGEPHSHHVQTAIRVADLREANPPTKRYARGTGYMG